MATRAQTAQHKKAFLEVFRVLGNVSAACRDTGVDRRDVYRWKENDAKFLEAFNDAEAESTELMEREAYRRAVEGVRRPIYSRDGNHIDTVYDYSDTLLMFLLKARAPQRFRERYDHQHSGANGAPLTFTLLIGDDHDGDDE